MLINNSLSAKKMIVKEEGDYNMLIISVIIRLFYLICSVVKFVHNHKKYDKCNFTSELSQLILAFGIQVILPIIEHQLE